MSLIDYLSLFPEKAVTLKPIAKANFTPMCPRPPIPIIATSSPALQYLLSGLYKVIPAQRIGAASFL